MLRQVIVGTAVSVCNIAIHAMVMVAVIRVAYIAGESATSLQSLRLIGVMIATVSVLMAAHLAEVLVWSFSYAIVSAAPPGTDLTYFAFVNYTTLGYGDVTPVERWHLLGPMTAMNGAVVWLVDRCHFCGPAENNDDEPDRRGTARERCIFRVIHPAWTSRRCSCTRG